MRVRIVTPAPPGSHVGNRVTALRWAGILRGLGHRVVVETTYEGAACDVLVALHARRSARSVALSRRLAPDRPIVLALTGTDLYRDLERSASARRSLFTADRIVVLQRLARTLLPRALRPKTRVIVQSCRPVARRPRRARDFSALVLAHLRPVKDPLRAALAARLLPASSHVRVVLAGAALSAATARRARAEAARNARFTWVGDLPRARALSRLARCDVLVTSSRLEGGASVVSEAVASGVPVLASRVDGNVGLLGAGHPGLFPFGDTRALARLLGRAEGDPRFLAALARAGRLRRPLFSPARERAAWRALLAELPSTRPRGARGARVRAASPAATTRGASRGARRARHSSS